MFADNLLSAVNVVNEQFMQDRLNMQQRYTNGFYNWDTRAMQWEAMLKGILNNE